MCRDNAAPHCRSEPASDAAQTAGRFINGKLDHMWQGHGFWLTIYRPATRACALSRIAIKDNAFGRARLIQLVAMITQRQRHPGTARLSPSKPWLSDRLRCSFQTAAAQHVRRLDEFGHAMLNLQDGPPWVPSRHLVGPHKNDVHTITPP